MIYFVSGQTGDGIFMVSHLSQRETAEELQQYRALKQQMGYWYALYPIHQTIFSGMARAIVRRAESTPGQVS